MRRCDNREFSSTTTPQRSRYTNAALTLIALGVGVVALQNTTGMPSAAEASGQRAVRSSTSPSHSGGEATGGMLNAAEQRIRMIDALQSIDSRLRAIETRLATPLDVRVVELPPEPNNGSRSSE